MTETEHITSAYQSSWTERLFYVSHRLYHLFLFRTEWHGWLTISLWVIRFFSEDLPLSPLFTLMYLCSWLLLLKCSIFCLSLLTASYFLKTIFFSLTEYFCSTTKNRHPQYLILFKSLSLDYCVSQVCYIIRDHSNNSIAKIVGTYQHTLIIPEVLNICCNTFMEILLMQYLSRAQ